MFDGDVDSSIIIGKPQYRLRGEVETTESGQHEGKSPFVSKIGGYAVWHDSATAPTDLICGNCARSDEMALVAQLYTPLEGIDRSMYIFCCNRRVCSLVSKGWMVIRNQRQKEDSTDAKTLEAQNSNDNNNLSSASKSSKASKSVWDFLKPTSSKSPSSKFSKSPSSKTASSTAVSVSGDDWVIVDEDGEENEDDLLALLEQRDASLQEKKEAVAMPVSLAHTKEAKQQQPPFTSYDMLRTTRVFPSWKLQDIEEQWSPDFALLDSDDECDNTDGILDDKNMSETAYTMEGENDTHIDMLIKSYLEAEEDPDIVKLLKNRKHIQQTGKAPVGADVDGASPTESVEEKEITHTVGAKSNTQTVKSKTKSKNMKKKQKRITKRFEDDDDDNEKDDQDRDTNEAIEDDKVDDDDESDIAGNSETKLSHSNATARVERYFQRRLKGQAWQVLRYAYGGKPLWGTHFSKHIQLGCEIIGSNLDTNGKGEGSRKGVEGARASVSVSKSKNVEDVVCIPACERCGACRTFEFQLMPALLSLLDTDSRQTDSRLLPTTTTTVKPTSATSAISATSATSTTSTTSTTIQDTTVGLNGGKSEEKRFMQDLLKGVLGEGMDFGVVAVWSCPNSCGYDSRCNISYDSGTGTSGGVSESGGRAYTVECVVVQPPPDNV